MIMTLGTMATAIARRVPREAKPPDGGARRLREHEICFGRSRSKQM